MRRTVTTALAAAAPLALLPIAPASAEEPLACGATVTEDVTLTADLTCDDVALVVAGEGVTVDLAGHTIRARLVVQPGASVGPDGIRLVGGTVAGGAFVGAGTVERMTFVDDARVGCFDGTLTVRDSTLRSSTVGAGLDCWGATVERNRFEDAGVDFWLGSGTIADNTFRGGDVAIRAMPSTDVTIARNRISGYETAMHLAGGSYRASGAALVHDNVVRGNGVGIRFDAGADYGTAEATIARNTVTGNRSHGIEVLFDVSEILGNADVTLEANRAIGNGGDGIHSEVAGEREVFDEPGAPYHDLRFTVRRNLALANAGTGIVAPDDEGVVDGGGNRAIANRGGACTGPVACK